MSSSAAATAPHRVVFAHPTAIGNLPTRTFRTYSWLTWTLEFPLMTRYRREFPRYYVLQRFPLMGFRIPHRINNQTCNYFVYKEKALSTPDDVDKRRLRNRPRQITISNIVLINLTTLSISSVSLEYIPLKLPLILVCHNPYPRKLSRSQLSSIGVGQDLK